MCLREHVCEVDWQCVFFIYIFIDIYIKMYKTYMLYFHKLGISLVTWNGNRIRSSSLMNESIMYPTAHDVWFIYAIPEGSLEPWLSLSSIPAVLREWLQPQLCGVNKHDKNQYSIPQLWSLFPRLVTCIFFSFLFLHWRVASVPFVFLIN